MKDFQKINILMKRMAQGQEVEFHEIEIQFFMRSKLFLFMRSNLFNNV